jgi:hypothetical protein
MPTFYRVLWSDNHFSDWNNGKFHSYHDSVPGEWSELYYVRNCFDKSKYPVDLFTGIRSQVALDNFLIIAPNYQHGVIWTNDHLKLVSQLEGVCAFRKPECAIKWADTNNIADYDKIVEFEGIEIGPIPETDNEFSGVLAKVVKSLEMYSLNDFKTRHSL